MTAKDYELIAGVIRDYPSFHENLRTARRSFAASFADKFSENPRFNRAKFLRDCELDKGEPRS